MTPKLPCPRPARVLLEGRYARLEPLALSHAEGLLAASANPESFAFLFDFAPEGIGDMRAWVSRFLANEETVFHVVVDKANGKVGGRQSLMRIVEGKTDSNRLRKRCLVKGAQVVPGDAGELVVLVVVADVVPQEVQKVALRPVGT